MKSRSVLILFAIVLSVAFPDGGIAGGFREDLEQVFGHQYQGDQRTVRPPLDRHRPKNPTNPAEWLRHWNTVAIDTSGIDHTPVAAGENRVYGEQFGPTRASRAMAIVHIAMFEAVNAIEGRYTSYIGLERASMATSEVAAIVQ